MKKCPFCKNEIDKSAAQCPNCKMTLMEKVESARQTEKTYAPPPLKEKVEKAHSYSYTPPKQSSPLKRPIKLPKGSGWIISILGTIILSAVFSGSRSSSSNPLPPPAPVATTALNIKPVVPIPHAPYFSLANGTVLFASSHGLDGDGELTIKNGSGSDAEVKLITNNGRKVYDVYVRANNNFTIKDIDDGVYRLLFAFGSNWDTSQKKFLVDMSAESFDDTFDFETSDDQYTTFTITLNPVIDGKATTSSLSPTDFDKY